MQERQNLQQDPEKKTRQSKALITWRELGIQAITIIMIIAITIINIVSLLILLSLVGFIKVNSGKNILPLFTEMEKNNCFSTYTRSDLRNTLIDNPKHDFTPATLFCMDYALLTL